MPITPINHPSAGLGKAPVSSTRQGQARSTLNSPTTISTPSFYTTSSEFRRLVEKNIPTLKEQTIEQTMAPFVPYAKALDQKLNDTLSAIEQRPGMSEEAKQQAMERSINEHDLAIEDYVKKIAQQLHQKSLPPRGLPLDTTPGNILPDNFKKILAEQHHQTNKFLNPKKKLTLQKPTTK
jgi:hypothetical protein